MEKLTFEKLAFGKPFVLYCVSEGEQLAYKSETVVMLPPYKHHPSKFFKEVMGVVSVQTGHGLIHFRHDSIYSFVCNSLIIKEQQSKASCFQYNAHTWMFLNREDVIEFLRKNFLENEKRYKKRLEENIQALF